MGRHYGNGGIIHWSVEYCRFKTLVMRLVKRTLIYILHFTKRVCSIVRIVELFGTSAVERFISGDVLHNAAVVVVVDHYTLILTVR